MVCSFLQKGFFKYKKKGLTKMKYLLILMLAAFTLSSCDPDRLIGWGDDKEDVRGDDRDRDRDNDDRERDRGEEVGIDELPEAIIDYIEENYADVEIIKAIFKDGLYLVYLDNGTILYFSREGRLEWITTGDHKDEDRDGDKRDGDRSDEDEDDDRDRDDIIE